MFATSKTVTVESAIMTKQTVVTELDVSSRDFANSSRERIQVPK
jgi:hypothetical protein